MEIGELNSLYQDAESAATELFAEQRSNLLLVSGQHYNKKGSQFWNRVRESDSISKDQKLRLTKNHIGKISKIIRNNILNHAPGVGISPQNPNELSDCKNAELHQSVWQDIKLRHKMKKKMREFVADFIDIGEAICKLGFDLDAGRFIGFTPQVGPDGQPVLDKNGEPAGTPIFSGDHTFERVFGFNFLVDPSANSFEEARHFIIRKMLPTKDLKKKFAGDEDKLRLVVESADERFKIFNGQTGQYQESKGMTMLREYYFRPCADYPKGYYYITTAAGILFEGELPLGILPIIYVGYDEMQTTPRAYSLVKQLRPYQAEINRTASKIAEHQITLGDDKLVLLGGSKMSHGASAHGVKAIHVNGSAPMHIQGRSGEQFVPYMQSQIDEMYRVANVVEETEDKVQGQLDAYAMLFRSIKDKKRFSLYAEKIEQFQIELCDLALRYAKHYYTDDMLVPAIGKTETINIKEFKNADDLAIQIKLEGVDDDVESRMGQQLVLNHALQFVGPNLDRSDIGMMLKNMPFANKDQIFDEMTIDSENATNDILALDRGEVVPVYPEDNHTYIIRKLTNRMKKRDFNMLPPQTQQNYANKRDQHQQAEAKRQQDIQMANSGYIPSGGYLVSCDMYVDVGPEKAPKRARIPYEALQWLLKKLESQGQGQAALQALDPDSQAAIGRMMGPPPDEASNQMPPMGPPN